MTGKARVTVSPAALGELLRETAAASDPRRRFHPELREESAAPGGPGPDEIERSEEAEL